MPNNTPNRVMDISQRKLCVWTWFGDDESTASVAGTPTIAPTSVASAAVTISANCTRNTGLDVRTLYLNGNLALVLSKQDGAGTVVAVVGCWGTDMWRINKHGHIMLDRATEAMKTIMLKEFGYQELVNHIVDSLCLARREHDQHLASFAFQISLSALGKKGKDEIQDFECESSLSINILRPTPTYRS